MTLAMHTGSVNDSCGERKDIVHTWGWHKCNKSLTKISAFLFCIVLSSSKSSVCGIPKWDGKSVPFLRGVFFDSVVTKKL